MPLQLSTLAAAVSLLIIPLMWRVAPHLGLVDLPDARKIHSTPVPRVGGWGITLGSLIPLLLWLKFDSLLQSFVLAILTLFIFGIWDDRKGIGHWTKFLGQILAAGSVVYYGDLYVSRLPFLDGATLDAAVGKPITMFALVGVINAINHSDGLDGLAAGESMLTLIGLSILGYLAGSVVIMSIALATMGGILGFLRYNSHPARVFMGDAGSQVLGFTLGFLTIYLTQNANSALSAALPLLLLGVPIADILAVLYQRIRAGQNWFKASRNHGHHRLLDLGLSHYQTVIIIYSVHAALVVAAVLLRYESDLRVSATYLLVIFVFFGALIAAERMGWRAVRRDAEAAAGLNRLLRESARQLIVLAAAAFMSLGCLWVARIPRDVGLVAAVLAAVLAAQLGFAPAVRSLVVRVAAYVAAIAAAYLVIRYPGSAPQAVEVAALALIGVLVAAIGIYICFAAHEKFGTTPTDYLIAFSLVALMVFAIIDPSARALVEIAVYAVVLLYGCEILIERSVKRWSGLNVVALLTLSTMAIRGLL
jgi:UDP-GlcNAc:undecaprenyl-phosphate GlcNAc-1-phosphate transferase